ncbi:MAG: hypothetical protein LBG04_02380 [Holosporaceae bacterium]|jgi:hypothetical protein|nr:hypothetical protein [Holosporaceae bacterium]
MEDYWLQAMLASIALSVSRKYLTDFVNDRETDPESLEFWKDVVNYSWLSSHFVDTAFGVWDLFSRKSGKYGDATSQLSTTMAWVMP